MIRMTAIACVLGFGCGGDPVSDVVGASCRDDLDCAERCERGRDFPGGFCTVSCRDDLDCTADSICTDVAGGVCLFPCENDRDCDPLGLDYVCKQRRDTFDRTVFVCLGR
jgi:hypothetical protein